MQDYFNRELERQEQAAQHRIAEAEHQAVLQQQQINMQMGGGAMLDGGNGALRGRRALRLGARTRTRTRNYLQKFSCYGSAL